jgi:2-iminobutanoate/2-iminopropanoate deaminase
MMSNKEKKIIQSDEAPAAIGPYSVAVGANDLVFTSGQIALDPKTGELVPGGIMEQTRQVLTNLQAVLHSAGTNLDNVVKSSVFLRDMKDFSDMNKVYGDFFSDRSPARTTIAVAGLPKNALIEIEVIALCRVNADC